MRCRFIGINPQRRSHRAWDNRTVVLRLVLLGVFVCLSSSSSSGCFVTAGCVDRSSIDISSSRNCISGLISGLISVEVVAKRISQWRSGSSSGDWWRARLAWSIIAVGVVRIFRCSCSISVA
jgi:hypothetical protein